MKKENEKTSKKLFFTYFSPRKGTLTLTPGMGMGGTFRTKIAQKITKTHKKIVRTKIVHTSETLKTKISNYPYEVPTTLNWIVFRGLKSRATGSNS